MSSIYSMQRPDFWRVPKFKSKDPQGPKKKVHFYDDFVSDLKLFTILLQFVVRWKCQNDRWTRVLSVESSFISETWIFTFTCSDYLRSNNPQGQNYRSENLNESLASLKTLKVRNQSCGKLWENYWDYLLADKQRLVFFFLWHHGWAQVVIDLKIKS